MVLFMGALCILIDVQTIYSEFNPNWLPHIQVLFCLIFKS